MASPNTQLALREPVKLVRPNKCYRTCWHLWKQHVSIDEIATRMGRTVAYVQKAIDCMESYRAQTSNEEVNMRFNEIVLANVDAVGKVFHDGLKAQVVTRQETTDPKTGKIKTKIVCREPDHVTRLKTAEMVQKAADRAIPKGAGVQVNVQQNNANMEISAGRSFVERLRARREARGLSNGVQVINAEESLDRDESADDFEEDGEE